MEVVTGTLYAAKNLAEGALLAAKGLTYPTHPLSATFKPISFGSDSPPPALKRAKHTLNVVKGRAYIFGGDVAPSASNPDAHLSNNMHILTLPSASLQPTDYLCVPARPAQSDGPTPPPRACHSAAVINNRIYIFGGRAPVSSPKSPSSSILNESGRVWVFDTTTLTWSHLDPNTTTPDPTSPTPASPTTIHPSPRFSHSSAASPHPLPPSVASTSADLASDEPLADRIGRPEPLQGDTHGTLILHGGILTSETNSTPTTETWALDISSRSWTAFPPAPNPPLSSPSLTIASPHNPSSSPTSATTAGRLYRLAPGTFDHLTLITSSSTSFTSSSETHAPVGSIQGHPYTSLEMPLQPHASGWTSAPFPVGSENRGGPPPRAGAGLLEVTSGQGRRYLLLFCGREEADGRVLDDMWAYQLPPAGGSAAAVKDATRQFVMKASTGEGEISEVLYHREANNGATPQAQAQAPSMGSADAADIVEGAGVTPPTMDAKVLVQEGQPRPMAGRVGFGADRLEDVAGSGMGGVVVWGGVGAGEWVEGGWLVGVE